MRLYHLAIALLVFLLSFSIGAWDMGDERDFKSLVDRSKLEQPACDRWAEEAKKAPLAKLAELVKTYPGTPPSTKSLWKKVKELPRDVKLDFSALYQAAQCCLAVEHAVVKRLIESADTFMASERAEISAAALAVTARDLDSPTTLVSVLTQLDVVKMLAAKKLVTPGTAQASKLQELGKIAAEAEMLRQKSRPTSKDFYRELDLAERIRPPLQELVSSLR